MAVLNYLAKIDRAIFVNCQKCNSLILLCKLNMTLVNYEFMLYSQSSGFTWFKFDENNPEK